MKKFLALLTLLVFVSSARATVLELCGDGIDDPLATGGSPNGVKGACPAGYSDATIGNGCDKNCPTPDQDNDGYNSTGNGFFSGIDCDDTDPMIYPGVITSKGCSVGFHRTCQASGVYTACTNATLCEATGSGICKYVDFTSGNDANPGTFASPYKTLGKVCGGSTGVPASPYSLNPGDVVYLLGSGTQATTYSNGVTTQVAEFTRAGTLANPITIKNYPTATSKIDGGMNHGLIVGAAHYKIEGIDVTSAHNIIWITADNVDISRSYIHDLNGDGNNNDGCIVASTTNHTVIHHNYLRDCLRGSGNANNISAITWIDTSGYSVGADHAAYYNTVWNTAYSATAGGNAIYIKHGVLASEAGAGHFVEHNTLINYGNNSSGGGLVSGTSKLRAMYNRFWGGTITTGAFSMGDIGGSIRNEDNRFQYNTIIQGEGLNWNPLYNPPEALLLDHNVIVGTDNLYSAGDADGIIRIDAYGSDVQLAAFEAGNYLTSDYNCWYSPNAIAVFSYFGENSGGGGHGPAGNAGSSYSFTDWKAIKGQDTHSFLEDPQLDVNMIATASDCATFGWQIAGVSPTPTPTPAPTATPTPTPTPSVTTSNLGGPIEIFRAPGLATHVVVSGASGQTGLVCKYWTFNDAGAPIGAGSSVNCSVAELGATGNYIIDVPAAALSSTFAFVQITGSLGLIASFSVDTSLRSNLDYLNTTTSELAACPTDAASMKDQLRYLYEDRTYQLKDTGAVQTLFKANGTTPLSVRSVGDVAHVYTRTKVHP